MKIQNIYIGSWFPKIKLHLDEFKQFLKDGSVHPALDDQKAKKLFKKLKPQNVQSQITSKNLAEIIVESPKNFNYAYYEDGLLLLKGPIKDFKQDKKKIIDFYQNTLTPCLAYIFSRGAEGLEIIRVPKLPKRIFLTVKNTSKSTIEKFFKEQQEPIDDMQTFKSFDIYFSKNLVAVNLKPTFPQKQADDIIQELIFLTEINRHLYWLMQTHREIWEEAKRILSIQYIKTKNIPVYIEKLSIDFKNTSNINSRIEQMKVALASRQESLKNIADKTWHDYFNNKFNKTSLETDYIKKIFIMTSKFLKNNINYLNSMYQEISKNSIRRLNLLFLINVVASFLFLGTILGANIFLYSKGELVAEGQIQAFSFPVLLAFGILTLILTSVIYYFWNYIFKNLARQFRK